MEKLILTDADGVICDWSTVFEKYLNELNIFKIPNTDISYNLCIRYGLSEQQMMKLVTDFNQSKIICDLPAFGDSIEYITKLSEKGFKFTVVSSVSDASTTAYYRYINLPELSEKPRPLGRGGCQV